MICKQTTVRIGMLLIASAVPMGLMAQTGDTPSCTGQLTQQLRRFSEKCVADVAAFVASQPRMGARIASESDKYYVLLIKDAKGFRAEALSKFNFPFVRDETIAALERLGWAPPENEGDNWKKLLADDVSPGVLAKDVSEALQAYGLKPGGAISLTVGPEVSS